MAKKSKSSKKRKQRKPNVPVYQVPAESTQEVASTPSQVVTAQAPISNPIANKNATTDSIDWASEYPYYASDMKRLGVIVALMVLLLLALNVIFIYAL